MSDFQKRGKTGLIERVWAEEDGSATVLSLYFTLIFLVVGGLAIDYNKVMSERTQLRTATDTAAHAALYTREWKTIPESVQAAMDVADTMLPDSTYGSAITSTDVTFGTWDKETLTFAADPGSRSAVEVVGSMTEARGNPSRNLLLRIIGQSTFDVETRTVYSTYKPPCFREGFVGDDVVDIQSGNGYYQGFCIHSNEYVSLNSNNYFEPGTIVSMPDLADLDMPSSGFESNIGLQAALRQGEYRLRILNQLPKRIARLSVADPLYVPAYIRTSIVENITAKRVDPADFVPNSVHYITCGGANNLTLDGGTYTNIVIVTGCDIKFGAGVILENVQVATTSTYAKSFNAPSGLQIGRDDNCTGGGGAVLMTLGGMDVAADLRVYGGQVLAIGDIYFSANANGIEGVSMVSYGQISGTSNMDMGFCSGNGQDDVLQADYFRMVN